MMGAIRTVELFAGVGGFRLGLEVASDRFKVVWANQWEPSMDKQYAFECYTAHFGHSSCHVCKDISKAKVAVPDHDLLVGGFPCQDYSVMKKRFDGIEGAKGRLWWQIDDIVRKKRPQYILLENVDGILRSPTKQCGRDLSVILRSLYEKGYSVEWRVINAAEYGQAQRRRRTFILACHSGTEMFQGLAEKVCRYGIKGMHDMPKWIYAKGKKHEKRYRRNGSAYYFSEGAVAFPESLDKPSRTMLTSEASIGRTSHVVTDPRTGRLRTLMPVECERLNGFPDGWTDTGMPERMRYFCMGNALVVPIVARIGKMLSAYIN